MGTSDLKKHKAEMWVGWEQADKAKTWAEWEQALWKWTKLKLMWAELMGTSDLKMYKAKMWAECEQTSWK